VEWAVGNGTTVLRSHVDVDSIGGLVPLGGLLALKREVADLVDLQIVAFPQEGILQDPGTDKLMEKAMELGADVVGGMPYNERTPEDSRRHVEICLELARRFDADVDMHVDETDDPGARTLAMLADATLRFGWQGRVTAGHTCALAAYPDPYAAKVIGLVKQAGMHMVTNPATNLMLQGRHDHWPIRRGITRVESCRCRRQRDLWPGLPQGYPHLRSRRHARGRADHRPRGPALDTA
jgi:cytosine deaminase